MQFMVEPLSHSPIFPTGIQSLKCALQLEHFISRGSFFSVIFFSFKIPFKRPLEKNFAGVSVVRGKNPGKKSM